MRLEGIISDPCTRGTPGDCVKIRREASTGDPMRGEPFGVNTKQR